MKMILRRVALYLAYFTIVGLPIYAQKDLKGGEVQNIRVGFYNIENLFDTINDPHTDDEEFTEGGKGKWDYARYQVKIRNLCKVISEMKPDLLGVCEAENAQVLQELIQASGEKDYGLVHYDSPDERGIDVALIYKQSYFRVLASQPIRVLVPYDSAFKTRDILWVRLLAFNRDTIRVLVSHWPSRRHGQGYRVSLAYQVKAMLDTLPKGAPVICMGDFNDDPVDESLSVLTRNKRLYNPFLEIYNPDGQGTLFFKNAWNLFDQILISSNLTQAASRIRYLPQNAFIFYQDWLLNEFNRPFRSYEQKQKYTGGFSDHLPIYLQLQVLK